METYNLDYLKSHSPNNPKFVAEMIKMFLEQTPPYLANIHSSLAASDWSHLHGHIHKVRPSMDLMGMSKEICDVAKKIEAYCKDLDHLDLVPAMVLQMEEAFSLTWAELKKDLKHDH
jgi:HPt (histidine-containing phosphotransfer) domain-containing protein